MPTLRNIGSHIYEKDATNTQLIEAYNKIADKYDADVKENHYEAPKAAADFLAELFVTNRDRTRILDMGCGTGLVGEEALKVGFRQIDGYDPSYAMVQIAKKKNVYRQTKCLGLSAEPLAIRDGTYDVVCICGFHGSPDPLCQGLSEMVRIVKPGGFVIFVMRKMYYELPEYQEKFKTKCYELEQEGIVQIRSRYFDRYHPDVIGMFLTLKKI